MVWAMVREGLISPGAKASSWEGDRLGLWVEVSVVVREGLISPGSKASGLLRPLRRGLAILTWDRCGMRSGRPPPEVAGDDFAVGSVWRYAVARCFGPSYLGYRGRRGVPSSSAGRNRESGGAALIRT